MYVLAIGLVMVFIKENTRTRYRFSDKLYKKIQLLSIGLVMIYIHDIRKHILANCGPLKEFIQGFLTSTERDTLYNTTWRGCIQVHLAQQTDTPRAVLPIGVSPVPYGIY